MHRATCLQRRKNLDAADFAALHARQVAVEEDGRVVQWRARPQRAADELFCARQSVASATPDWVSGARRRRARSDSTAGG
jgi:hypothetical protein